MKIPLAKPWISPDDVSRVTEVIQSGRLSLGPATSAFEQSMAGYVQTQSAVAVNSGTSGLHLIIRALGIGSGNEVITTPFSFVASTNCILMEGATPVFVDIEPRTLCLDPELVEAAVTPRTKAILAVDVFGHPANWNRLEQIAENHDLLLIGVRPSLFGFVPLVNASRDHTDRRVAQPHECTYFLQCIIVPPLCGCWRSVE